MAHFSANRIKTQPHHVMSIQTCPTTNRVCCDFKHFKPCLQEHGQLIRNLHAVEVQVRQRLTWAKLVGWWVDGFVGPTSSDIWGEHVECPPPKKNIETAIFNGEHADKPNDILILSYFKEKIQMLVTKKQP